MMMPVIFLGNVVVRAEFLNCLFNFKSHSKMFHLLKNKTVNSPIIPDEN